MTKASAPLRSSGWSGRIRSVLAGGWPGWRMALGAAIAGLMAAAGQEPMGLWGLALAGYALLARLVADAPRGVFWIGLLAGAAHFATALSWIVEPFLIEPEVYGWMIPFAVAGLAFGLGLFWGAAACAARRFFPMAPATGFALCLTAAEMLRGHVLTGFPWALPGHIWFQSPVVQGAAAIGAYGLTLFTLLVASLAARLRPLPALTAAALLTLGWVWGMRDLAAPMPAPTDLVLRLVQPNAEQHLKWDPDLAATHFDRLIRLSTQGPAVDLVIWPETALPYLFENHPELWQMVAAAGQGAPVALGVQRAEGDRAWNSLTVVAPDTTEAARYDKAHLVPFGEYIPAGDLMYRWFGIRAFASQLGAGYTPGPGPALIDLGPRLGFALPLICYEAVFPQDLRDAPGRADWLLQITNDAWFGTVSGPFQHAALARLRAIENGLPLIRVANTGVTVVFDARGRTTASLPPGKAGVLDATLPGALPPTPYARFGEAPVLLCLAGLAALLLRRRRRIAA